MTKNVLARERVSEATQNYLLLNRITSAISATVLRSAAQHGQVTRVRIQDALVEFCDTSVPDWRELASSAVESEKQEVDHDTHTLLLRRMHTLYETVLIIVKNEARCDPPTSVTDALDRMFISFPQTHLRPCLTQDVARSK